MVPYLRDRPPQELLPAMPPMVAREAVETSTGNHRPCCLSFRLRSSSTIPGSTTQLRLSMSSERRRFRCFEKSTTMPSLTVWPHCEVPAAAGGDDPPLIPRDRERPQRSSMVRGTTTPTGMI